ncbi:MAG: phosphohistidine phosphatase SixA [Planctomycetota bacterium]|jgi:phosphohistidine phosphatase
MRLYLVQHAKALSKQENPERPLSEEGRRDMQKIAAFLGPLDLAVDYLWHSGKLRAAQTADFLAEIITVAKATTAREGLGPTDDVGPVADELAAIDDCVMVVGHLPFLVKLASLLLTGSESADTVAFKNGGLVCLARSEENRWQVEWMVTPELL